MTLKELTRPIRLSDLLGDERYADRTETERLRRYAIKSRPAVRKVAR